MAMVSQVQGEPKGSVAVTGKNKKRVAIITRFGNKWELDFHIRPNLQQPVRGESFKKKEQALWIAKRWVDDYKLKKVM